MQPYANSTARQNAYAHHTGTASQPYSYDASATAALHSAPAQYTAGQQAAVPSTASHPPAHPSQAHHSAAQQQDQAPDLSHAPHHSHPPAAAQPADPPPTHPQQHHQSHQHQQQQHQRQHQQSYPQPELDLPSSAGQSHPRWQGSPSPAPGQSGSDQGGTHNQGSLPGEDVGVAAGGRRHVGIKAKSWAGSVVWAKLARYPWWPAQVLDDHDPFIPTGSEPPRRGAVPVRFFGTYEFSWIESQRTLAAFDDLEDDRRSKCNTEDFRRAVEEADDCQAGGKLPRGFSPSYEPDDLPPQAVLVSRPSSKSSRSRSKAKPRKSDGLPGKGPAQRKPKGPAASAPQRRKDRILRALALKAPTGSPFAEQPCLAGAELLTVQTKPPTPPPQPPPPPVSIPALPPMIPQSWSLAHLSKMSQGMAPDPMTQQFASIAGLRFQPGVFPQLLQQPLPPQPHAPAGHGLLPQ